MDAVFIVGGRNSANTKRLVRISQPKAPSVFDLDKCEWLNGQHINRAPVEELIAIAQPLLVKAGLIETELSPERREWLGKVIDLMRDRMRTVGVLANWAAYYFTDDFEYEERARGKWLRKPETPEALDRLAAVLETVEPWAVEPLEAAVRQLAETMGVGAAKVIHPCRAAVTGTTVGPSLFHLLELLPREAVVRRLRRAAEQCRAQAFAAPGPEPS